MSLNYKEGFISLVQMMGFQPSEITDGRFKVLDSDGKDVNFATKMFISFIYDAKPGRDNTIYVTGLPDNNNNKFDKMHMSNIIDSYEYDDKAGLDKAINDWWLQARKIVKSFKESLEGAIEEYMITIPEGSDVYKKLQELSKFNWKKYTPNYYGGTPRTPMEFRNWTYNAISVIFKDVEIPEDLKRILGFTPLPTRSVSPSPLPARSVSISPLPARSVSLSPLPARYVSPSPLPARSLSISPLPARSLSSSSVSEYFEYIDIHQDKVIKLVKSCFPQNLKVYNKVLGRGGFGTVFLTCDLNDDETDESKCTYVIKAQTTSVGYHFIYFSKNGDSDSVAIEKALDEVFIERRVVNEEMEIQDYVAKEGKDIAVPVKKTVGPDGKESYMFTCKGINDSDPTFQVMVTVMKKLDDIGTFDKWIETNRDKRMIDKLINMLNEGRRIGLYHGDLKFDNIGIYKDKPVFIDFGKAGINLTIDDIKRGNSEGNYGMRYRYTGWSKIIPNSESFIQFYDTISLLLAVEPYTDIDFMDKLFIRLIRLLENHEFQIYYTDDKINITDEMTYKGLAWDRVKHKNITSSSSSS